MIFSGFAADRSAVKTAKAKNDTQILKKDRLGRINRLDNIRFSINFFIKPPGTVHRITNIGIFRVIQDA